MRTPILSLVMILHKLFAYKASGPEDSDFQESQFSSRVSENGQKTTNPHGQKTKKITQSGISEGLTTNAACKMYDFSIIRHSM